MTRSNYRPVYLWLWSGVILISLMVIIGGITRLTDSGLSMSDWNLIMGTIPPLNEAEWISAFERYQEFPQFQKLNSSMQLEEFKSIYFWEYLHRLIGRFTGLIFLIPFLYFWIRGTFDASTLKRMFVLLALGALQGAMGWIMVKSGLVELPYVSHYRLAIHLTLAFILLGCCLWFALDIKDRSSAFSFSLSASLKKWMYIVGGLFVIQLIYGAFTAGLDAGFMYNTFPKMAGYWIPPTVNILDPFILNLIENPGTVQWIHRINGTLLLAAVAVFWWKSIYQHSSRLLHALGGALFTIILFQYLLGIFTLIYRVPLTLGVLHQAVAIFFWIVYLMIVHRSTSTHQVTSRPDARRT